MKQQKLFNQKLSNSRWKNQIIIFAGVFCLLLLFHLLTGNRLLKPNNIRNLVVQSVYPTFVSFGMMFIFGAGFVDFSIGANSIFAVNMGVVIAQYFNGGYLGLIVTTIAVAVILELITMFLVVRLNIPSWIAGLGMMLVYETCVIEILMSLPFLKGTYNLQLTSYRALGTLPFMASIWALGFLAAFVIYNYTTISFNLQAVGNSPQVASAMGINRGKTIYIAAIIGAVFIALGAVADISYTGQTSPYTGMGSMGLMFKPLATTLLSGSVARYINKPVGIMLGAFLISCVFNVLILLGVPTGTWQDFFLGSIVIICGIVANMGNKGVVK